MSSEQTIDLETMDFEAMRRLWRGQHDADIDWDTKELLMDVKKKAKKFDRVIVWRDRREVITAIVTSSLMAAVSAKAPGWLPMVGALAVIACCVYVCARLLRTRRRFPGADAPMPLADGLRAEIAKVEAQTELLRTVRDWYVLPIAIGGTMWASTLMPYSELPAGKALAIAAIVPAASILIFTLVGAAVVALNKCAIRKQLDPYRRDLERLLAQVEA